MSMLAAAGMMMQTGLQGGLPAFGGTAAEPTAEIQVYGGTEAVPGAHIAIQPGTPEG